ncbi:MAG: Rieske 2Fe-2S domain-containing protein [Betaproteobacteria bacterium]|nr:Rieske 2Fe-2S domain-containing protein [Betaproteobacteria bacterium]
MADAERLKRLRDVCARESLADGGRAVTFEIQRAGRAVAAFAYAFKGEVHAAVNVCPHRGTPLDWQPGEVFDESGIYLICATHGALFEPDSGLCIAGPCGGASLQKLPVRVIEGRVELTIDHRAIPGELDPK